MSAKLQTNADARAMRTTKFPPEFNEKVNVKKINLDVIKIWVQDEVLKILGTEDDVVTEMILDMLQKEKSPDIKTLQTSLTGFLDKDAASFCKKLWNMCLSAQKDPNGIPEALLEAKKKQMREDEEAIKQEREQATQRQAEERARDRELAHIRDRERGQRNRGGRGGGRGRDRDRSPDRRPSSRDSRSPPPRRRDAPRGLDSYVPGGRGRRDNPAPRRRRRSPSYGRSPSRSRSPPRRRRRYDSSPGVSRSPPRRRSFADGSEDDQDRSGHKASRKRSLSPRRRRSPEMSISCSPPRRRRGASPSRSRSPRRYRDSSSRSPPPKRRNRRDSNDLMSRTDRPRDTRRLSRDDSSFSGSIDAGAEETHNNPNRRGPPKISKSKLIGKLNQERMLYARRRDSAISMPPPQGHRPPGLASFPPSLALLPPGFPPPGFPPPGFLPPPEDTRLPHCPRGPRGPHEGAYGPSR